MDSRCHGHQQGMALPKLRYILSIADISRKDECVTVKSPSKDILVENIYCNWSGGCAVSTKIGAILLCSPNTDPAFIRPSA